MLAGADITPGVLNNTSAVSDPTPSDDLNSGYDRGSLWINIVTNSVFICANNAVGSAVWTAIHDVPWKEEEFVSTVGQITFIISNIPEDGPSIEFYVNGVLTDRDVQYDVSGTTFTWKNVPFSLNDGDFVQIRYK